MHKQIPTFSVVIATYNRPLQLQRCLEAVANQDYPREAFEVIVVDDGGDEPLTKINDLFGTRLSLIFLRQQNAGPASARNTGARHAKRQYIAFTDDDCIPARDWLQQFANTLAHAPDQLCGGRILNGLPDNVYSAGSQTILDVVYMWQAISPALRFFTTNNMSISAEKFLECGGLDPLFRVSEDREFCDRWTHNGGKLTYVPEAIVYHQHNLTFSEFVQQHFSYGRGAFRFYLRRTRAGREDLRVDPHFYLRLLRHSIKRPPVLGAILMAQLANAGGYFWERFATGGGSR